MRATLIGAAAAVCATVTLAPDASAAGLRVRWGFTQARPGVATSSRIHVWFPTDARGRPRQLAGLDFEWPAGTRIDRSVAATCAATDDQISAQGIYACPRASEVGQGAAKAVTGFGPPVDPLDTDAHTFKTATGTVNVFTPHGLPEPTLYRTRQRYDGRWVRDSFPPPPGGFPPPNGKSLPLEAQFTLDKRAGGRSWVATPHACPASRAWTARVVVRYASGGSSTVIATTPCRRAWLPGRSGE